MNITLWLVVGGIIGWLTSRAMHASVRREGMINMVVGICGAMLGGWFFTPLLGLAAIDQRELSGPSLLISLIAAILAIVGAQSVGLGKPR